jgi:hypothetical protein
MKSFDCRFIVPDDFDIEDLARVLDDIDYYTFHKGENNGEFQVHLKHSLLTDRLFIIEEQNE